MYVRYNREKRVKESLEEKEIECFLPLVKTVSQWTDRKKTIARPLFPSYIFIKPKNVREFHRAAGIDGVVKYVTFGKTYAQITDSEINKIKLLIGESEISDIETKPDTFRVGDTRRIAVGPFKGMECEVVKVNSTDRIIVRLKALQQVATASFPSSLFEEKS